MKTLRPILAALTASVAAVGIGCLLAAPPAGSQGTPAQAAFVDAAGNMRIPDNYRTLYEYLGSWSVAGDDKGAKEMHTVYASPGTTEAYRATGTFPDGSILVKEVSGTATMMMTTGIVRQPQGLVHDGERRQKQPSGQQALGQRLGMVLVRCWQSDEDHLEGVSGRLSGLPHPRQGDRLDLRVRLSRAEEIEANPPARSDPAALARAEMPSDRHRVKTARHRP
jgi:hypothetical protein